MAEKVEAYKQKFRVIPVIDILNGAVVHAVKGIRNEYKPIESVICKSAEPVEVARSFKNLGFTELYVADLDAIIDCSMDFQVLKRLSEETGLLLMIDAGVTDLDRAERLLKIGAIKLVIGTETLQNKSFVDQAIKRFGGERVVVSLDLKGDKIIAKSGFDGCPEPLCLLSEFKELGVLEIILLDLLRVGTGEGVNMDLLKKAASLDLDVVVGGGVRDMQDLAELKRLDISGALIATTLHSGKITVEDLKRERHALTAMNV